jgi:hypothetical protein
MHNNCLKAGLAVAVLVLTACSDAPSPPTTGTKTDSEKKEAGPPQPVTAKSAFYEMYKLAHSWSPDVMVLGLVAKDVAGVKNADGKYGGWTATFASASKKSARIFNYSVTNAPGVVKGVDVAAPIPWGGPSRDAMPFPSSDIGTDSDEAYKTAAGLAESWLKAHPDKPVTMSLGLASRFTAPVWYIMWGDKKDGYAALIDAVSGKPLNKK